MKIAENLLSNKLIALCKTGDKYEFSIKNDKILYKNHPLDFQLSEDENEICSISVNGKNYPVELISNKQNQYEILINGNSYLFSIETPSSLHRQKVLSRRTPNSNDIEIKAPMPGKIIDILVQTGQQVKEGDPLLTLEAMKMQNIIISEKGGTIKQVKVKTPSNVEKDDILLIISQQ